MAITVEAVYSYPVKGLGGVRLQQALVGANGLAHDRRFGIAFAAPQALLDGDAPWRPWQVFVSLKKHALAAHLSAAASGEGDDLRLHLHHRDGRRAEGRPHAPAERRRLEAFLQDALQHDAPLTLVDSQAQPLWDDALPLTLINMESLSDLAAQTATPMQAARFRPNIIVRGAAAWAEESWRGMARAGGCRLRLGEGVPRCAATTVHPDTAERDCRPPQMLVRLRGNADFGIFAQVAQGGALCAGQEFALESPA